MAPATLFGASIRRVEDSRFLTGRGRYADDLRLHASSRAPAAR